MTMREGDEDYDHVIAYLGPNWRVIEDRDDLQWIVQEKSGVWRNRCFCTSKAGVERRVRDLPGWTEMATLPERYVTRAERKKAAAATAA